MKIFELYFNPEKEDKFCESFYHDPKDAYQRRIGRLYMVGEVNKARKVDSTLLSNIFHAAKEKYYENPSLSPDQALKEALKSVNRIIESNEYLGRVSITFLSSKNFSIYIGKVGKVKTFLLSNGKIADIGKEIEESGSTIFQNIVCGKMKKKDKIVVLTPGMHTPFLQGKILEEMTQSSLDDEFMEKISTLHEKKFPNITGASLVIDYTMSIKDNSIIPIKREDFSFKKTFTPLFLKLGTLFEKKPKINKKIFKPTLIILTVFLVGLGSTIIIKNIKETRNLEAFSMAVETITRGEVVMEEGDLQKAITIFEDALSQLSAINSKKAEEKERELKEYLYLLFGREELESTTLLGEIEEFTPQNIVFYNNKLHLFWLDKMAIMLEDGSYEIKEVPQSSLSTTSLEGVILFSGPDKIIRIMDGEITSSEILPPYEEHFFIALSSFNNRAYFLEESKDEIIFYGERRPSLWIKEGEKKHKNGKDIAIDRSIFVLDKENKIHRYYTGSYEEEISFSLYPSVVNIEKIHTGIDIPLFLIESAEKRIILLDKEGGVIKQIHSEDFYNIKDITTSPDGKKIYLLVDQKVYLIEL